MIVYCDEMITRFWRLVSLLILTLKDIYIYIYIYMYTTGLHVFSWYAQRKICPRVLRIEFDSFDCHIFRISGQSYLLVCIQVSLSRWSIFCFCFIDTGWSSIYKRRNAASSCEFDPMYFLICRYKINIGLGISFISTSFFKILRNDDFVLFYGKTSIVDTD